MLNAPKVLKKASYNGIEFFVETNETGSGKRLIRYDLPYQKNLRPYVEDLGKKSKEWTITGFITGPNCLTERNRLMAELEKDEPGDLIHPFHGRAKVKCAHCVFKESNEEQEIVEFSLNVIEFSEFDFKILPVETPVLTQPGANLLSRCIDLLNSVSDAGFNSSGYLGNTTSRLARSFSSIGYATNAAESLKRSISRLGIQSSQSLTSPVGLFHALSGILSGLSSFGIPEFDLLAGFSNFIRNQEAPVDSTPADSVLNETIGSATHLELANTAIAATQAEPEKGHLIEDTVLESSDHALGNTQDDELFRSIEEITSKTLEICAEFQAQRRKRTVEIPYPTNALSLSFDLFGTVNREQELITMNAIEHPGFIPARPLEVRHD